MSIKKAVAIVEREITFKIVGNLLAEFGAGNLVILAFNDADMAALRRLAKGDLGAFVRARVMKGIKR